MKAIIWGLTFNDAKIKLLDIEEKYRPYTNVATKCNTNSTYEIIFENGDRWFACEANDGSRGHRCNISYVDSRISQEIVNGIIKNCTTAEPYQAITYFEVEN